MSRPNKYADLTVDELVNLYEFFPKHVHVRDQTFRADIFKKSLRVTCPNCKESIVLPETPPCP